MAIEAVDLGFQYGEQHIIKQCTFKLEKGKIYCILGRNGSGKTTLLKLLNGLLKPCAGRVLLEGQDVQDCSRKKLARIMGCVPQEHTGVFSYRVREMVVMGRNPHLGLFDRPSKSDYEIADEALNKVGLLELGDRSYMKISGGERQMVFLARAIAQEASYFLMDEPTSHLDFYNQHTTMNCLRQIVKQQGCGAVIAMHDPNLTMTFADEVLMLKDGTVFAQGPVDKVMTGNNLKTLYNMDIHIASLPEGKRIVVG
ncbi:MAG: ABC transporter ATP-binding protein [Bacillota bacterium]|nr:ABC transporter ATP-binding protein [Bacillota bacterium]